MNRLARMRAWSCLLILSVGFVSGGATCARRGPAQIFPPPPPILSATPPLQEVVAAVNRTSVIRELSSNSTTVDVVSEPTIPKLSAIIALRKEKEFRLRASVPVIGTSMDMGSNNALFWFEVPESMSSRTLYYASHEQYQNQLHRAVLPVDPTWVMDSLGLVQIDPSTVTQGPIRTQDGKLAIVSSLNNRNNSALTSTGGGFQRVCYIDAQAGHVTDQMMYSPTGQLIARSSASNHQFYPDQQCSLPHTIEIELLPPGAKPMQLRIDVGSYAINQILSGDPNLFTMPQGANNVVDLTQIGPPAGMVAPTGYQSNSGSPLPLRGASR